MSNILSRYISKSVFCSIIITLLILVSLSFIIKFIDQLKKIGQGDYSLIGALTYTLLGIPKDIQIFFPMSAVVGGLVGLGNITQNNELLAMQASGFANMSVISSVIKTTIPLILLSTSISEWITPISERIARKHRAQLIYGSSLITYQKDLWVKNSDNFVHIEQIKENDELSGLSIYKFNQNKHLQSIVYANLARFDTNRKLWILFQVSKTNFKNIKKVSVSQNAFTFWKTNMTPDRLATVISDPDTLSISGLCSYISYLKSSGQDNRRYQFNMWSKLFYPISTLLLILAITSLTFGPLHKSSIKIRSIAGVFLSFLFYLINQIFGSLILVYYITPFVGVFLPNFSLFLISLWLLLKYS